MGASLHPVDQSKSLGEPKYKGWLKKKYFVLGDLVV